MKTLFAGIEGSWMNAERIKLKTLLAALLSVAFLEMIGTWIIHFMDAPPLASLGLIRLLDVVVLILVVVRYEGGIFQIGLSAAKIPAGIRRGALWSLAFGFVAGSVALILYGFDINPLKLIKTPLPKSISGTVQYFIVGGIIGPAAEELFFRGVVFLYFRPWGFLPALILSTTFFTLLHPLSSGIPLPQILGGLLFASAFEVEKNLLVPVFIHISGNLAIFIVSWLTL